MRASLSVLFALLIISLLVCAVLALRSKKPVGRNIANLLVALAIPVLGNLILIASSDDIIANVGCYIYFLGMDASVCSIFYFTHSYCEMGRPKRPLLIMIYSLFGIDLLHYALNPYIGLSFATEKIIVEGRAYYRLVPYIGQAYHRVVCYSLFIASIIIFVVVTSKASKVYVEKYSVILFSMVITGAIESYYIFSGQPMDMSMIGFAVFGLLVYFFALHYRSMRVLDRLLASMASDMPDAIFFFDNSGKCIWTNEPGRKLIGISKDKYDDVKANLQFLFDDIDFEKAGWEKKVIVGEGDDAQYLELSMRSAIDDLGKLTGSYLNVHDYTDEQLAMQKEIYNSTHDKVTGFYTKEYLFEKISKRLSNDNTTDYMAGYIEIANYKMINDVFGSEFGTLTIKKVAQTIQENSSKKTLFGRLGNDSFGMLIDKSQFDESKLERLLETFSVSDENMEHHILIHFGVYDFSKDEDIDLQLFFDSARLATTVISDNYHNKVVFYDDKLRSDAVHDQLISNQLKEAIETKQIRPYLQPIVDSQGLLAGAEALVRWIHPEEGFLNPGQFIPVFERNGLISFVDKYMWRCACELLASWKEKGIKSFISVNVSPKDFLRLDVVSEMKSLVEEFGIKPEKLRIEITETAVTTENVDMFKIISDLREYGFIVEMDDFGSGYSSLNLLKDISIDLIKIDMQFLKDSERNMKAGLIIKSIINMSDDLGIDTLTEGVETAKQFEKLYDMGCKLYQGYYFSKPIPVEDFEKQWFD